MLHTIHNIQYEKKTCKVESCTLRPHYFPPFTFLHKESKFDQHASSWFYKGGK